MDEYYDAKEKRIAKAKATLKKLEELLTTKDEITFEEFKKTADALRDAILDIE